MSDDTYQDIGYGAMEIGFGERPGILVVDFQTGFTQPQFPLGNCPLEHYSITHGHILQQRSSFGIRPG